MDDVRKEYKPLSDEAKAQMAEVKIKGQELIDMLKSFGSSRELSLALTKTEEAVMWATKHITA